MFYTFRALAKTHGTIWLRRDVCRRYARLKLAGLHDVDTERRHSIARVVALRRTCAWSSLSKRRPWEPPCHDGLPLAAVEIDRPAGLDRRAGGRGRPCIVGRRQENGHLSSVRRARGQSRDDRDDHKTVAHPFPALARTFACNRVTYNLEKKGSGVWDVSCPGSGRRSAERCGDFPGTRRPLRS